MSSRRAEASIIAIGKIAVLLAIFALLVFALPMILNAVGIARRLTQAGFGGDVFQYIYIACGLLLIVGATMTLRRTALLGALSELGLQPFPVRATLVGLLAVASMIGVLRLAGRSTVEQSAGVLFALGISGPFAEEVLFRGFVFRQMRRWAGVPFWIAAIFSSILFGLEHLYQGNTLVVTLEAVGVTTTGGLLFSWLAERWNTIWICIVLHGGLNLAWEVFGLGENAVGGRIANFARLTAIVLVIAVTLAMTGQAMRLSALKTRKPYAKPGDAGNAD